jgi:hypothetical protein
MPLLRELGEGELKHMACFLSFRVPIYPLVHELKISHVKRRAIFQTTACCPCFEVLSFMTDSSSFVCVLCEALASVAVSNWELLSINFQFTTKIGGKTSLGPSYLVL